MGVVEEVLARYLPPQQLDAVVDPAVQAPAVSVRVPAAQRIASCKYHLHQIFFTQTHTVDLKLIVIEVLMFLDRKVGIQKRGRVF